MAFLTSLKNHEASYGFNKTGQIIKKNQLYQIFEEIFLNLLRFFYSTSRSCRCGKGLEHCYFIVKS